MCTKSPCGTWIVSWLVYPGLGVCKVYMKVSSDYQALFVFVNAVMNGQFIPMAPIGASFRELMPGYTADHECDEFKLAFAAEALGYQRTLQDYMGAIGSNEISVSKSVHLICGAAGSGKLTLAENVLKKLGYAAEVVSVQGDFDRTLALAKKAAESSQQNDPDGMYAVIIPLVTPGIASGAHSRNKQPNSRILALESILLMPRVVLVMTCLQEYEEVIRAELSCRIDVVSFTLPPLTDDHYVSYLMYLMWIPNEPFYRERAHMVVKLARSRHFTSLADLKTLAWWTMENPVFSRRHLFRTLLASMDTGEASHQDYELVYAQDFLRRNGEVLLDQKDTGGGLKVTAGNRKDAPRDLQSKSEDLNYKSEDLNYKPEDMDYKSEDLNYTPGAPGASNLSLGDLNYSPYYRSGDLAYFFQDTKHKDQSYKLSDLNTPSDLSPPSDLNPPLDLSPPSDLNPPRDLNPPSDLNYVMSSL